MYKSSYCECDICGKKITNLTLKIDVYNSLSFKNMDLCGSCKTKLFYKIDELKEEFKNKKTLLERFRIWKMKKK